MDIIITMRSDKPIYEQIESQLKEMIVSQRSAHFFDHCQKSV